ncbi:tetratricopeptide repeat protein, partial [candidate division KSB1 bacterium]|nr:tetratricopeptide repeat protein [candidate division KSB1 bacterium]
GYPDTEYADEARKRLGIIPEKSLDEELFGLFQDAEKQYLDYQNYDLALSKFAQIVDMNPLSTYATKSLYAIGWIYDNSLHDNDKAMETYQRIVEEYPETDYARQVKKKLDAVERAKNDAEQEKKKQETEVAAPDTSFEEIQLAEAQPEETEEVDVSEMDKEAYYEYLRKEMTKSNPRLKYPERIIK